MLLAAYCATLVCMQELLSGSSDASSSLMRQIQALSQQASAAQASAAEQEQLLLGRLRAAEQTAAAATAAERDAASRATSAEAGLQAAREAAAAAVQVGCLVYLLLFRVYDCYCKAQAGCTRVTCIIQLLSYAEGRNGV
jgi:predicted lipid-binding transport protein (Tim44 family)